jgi:predicted amidohydrolase
VQVLGTVFKVSARTDSTRLEVLSGSVRLTRTADQAAVVVSGGEFVVADASGELTKRSLQPVETWTAALIQPELPQGASDEQNLTTVISLIEAAAAKGARLIVLPDAAIYAVSPTGLPRSLEARLSHRLDSAAVKALCNAAAKNKVFVAAGLYVRNDAGTIFNRALLIDDSGTIILQQDKNNLASREMAFAQAGQGYPTVQTALGRIGMLISKDVYSHRAMNQFGNQELDLLLVLNSDPDIDRYHALLSRFAGEKNITVLMANSVSHADGHSAAYLPGGETRKAKSDAAITLIEVPKK